MSECAMHALTLWGHEGEQSCNCGGGHYGSAVVHCKLHGKECVKKSGPFFIFVEVLKFDSIDQSWTKCTPQM